MNDNYGFAGAVPPGVSVANNVFQANQYQATHTPKETFDWFYERVRNNKDGHLPPSQSMDYKQLEPKSKYADFGNFNYGAVGRALGIPDAVLEYGAGWAQGKADGLSNAESIARSLLDHRNKGDNPGDQQMIRDGIDAARSRGFTGRRQKLSATPDLSGTVLPCLTTNSALKSAPTSRSVCCAA